MDIHRVFFAIRRIVAAGMISDQPLKISLIWFDRPAPPEGHAGRMAQCHLGYWAPDGAVSFSITLERLKLAGFWRGGNSPKVCRKFPT